MHYNFKQDLQDGQRAEREAIGKLQIHFPEISGFRQCDTKDFDIEGVMDGQLITFEVKNGQSLRLDHNCR